MDVGIAVFQGLFFAVFPQTLAQNYKFPLNSRMFFVASFGLITGTQVTFDLIAQFRYVWVSLISVTIFGQLAFGSNY